MVLCNGQQHILSTPTDLPNFCDALNLGPVELPDWYADFKLAPLERSPPRSPFSTSDKRQSKKQKQSGGSKVGTFKLHAAALWEQEEG